MLPPSHYTLKVKLTGLEPGSQLVLKDQATGSVLDDLTLTEDGSYDFSGELKLNDVYDLAVVGLTQNSQFVDTSSLYAEESARQRHQCNLTGGAGTAEGVDQNIEVSIECNSDLVFTTFLDPDGDEYGVTQFWSWDGVDKHLIHELAETQWIIHWFVVNNKLLLVIGDVDEDENVETLVQALDEKGLQLLKRFNGDIYDDTLRFHDGSLYFIAKVESGAAPSFYRASDAVVTELPFEGSFVLSGNDRDRFTVGDAGVYATTDGTKKLWKLNDVTGIFENISIPVDPIGGQVYDVIDNLSLGADRLYITLRDDPQGSVQYKHYLWFFDAESEQLSRVLESPAEGLGYYLPVGEDFLFVRGNNYYPTNYSSSLWRLNKSGDLSSMEAGVNPSIQHHSQGGSGFTWEGKNYFSYNKNTQLDLTNNRQVLWGYGEDWPPTEVVYEQSFGTPSSTFYNHETLPYRINNVYPLQDAVLVRIVTANFYPSHYQFYMLTGSESGGLIERHLALPEGYLTIDADPVAYMDGQLYFHGSAVKEQQTDNGGLILVGEKGVWKADRTDGVIRPVFVESFTPSESGK